MGSKDNSGDFPNKSGLPTQPYLRGERHLFIGLLGIATLQTRGFFQTEKLRSQEVATVLLKNEI